jgi:hypothetical protein
MTTNAMLDIKVELLVATAVGCHTMGKSLGKYAWKNKVEIGNNTS